MDNLITDIPECPASLDTIESRVLWMDLCEEKIRQQRLTQSMLECIKGYVFVVQISQVAERELIEQPDSMVWHDVMMMCTKRMLECSEMLGLTPLDRKNLNLGLI